MGFNGKDIRGKNNPMWGLFGKANPLYGRTMPLEQRKKISEARKGWNPSEETRKRMSESKKGRKLTEEWKRKIGDAGRGRVPSEEARRKASEALRWEKHSSWQGDAVSYKSLHRWVRKWLPKSDTGCTSCHRLDVRLDVAYRDHFARRNGIKYSRDLSMWIWMCRKCHVAADKRYELSWQVRKQGG